MPKPIKVIRLHPIDDKMVRVFFWRDVNDLQSATSSDDAYGMYQGRKTVIGTYRGKKKVSTKKLGDIHLALDQIGAGYVAHELQHFISHWQSVSGWDDPYGEDWEPLSKLAGDITNEFWVKFYENFEEGNDA